jgi:hypothetical protein
MNLFIWLPAMFVNGPVLCVHESLRTNIAAEYWNMIYLTVIVASLVFIYLIVALVRPEWF